MALLTICGSCRVSIRKARDIVSVVQRRQQPRWTSRPHGADRSRGQSYRPDEEVFGCHRRDHLFGAQRDIPISGPAEFDGIKSVPPDIRIVRHAQVALRLQGENFVSARGALRG